jgi:hypothetical protein
MLVSHLWWVERCAVVCFASATGVVDGVLKIHCPLDCGDLHLHWSVLALEVDAITKMLLRFEVFVFED